MTVVSLLKMEGICASKRWARNILNEIMRTEKKMVRRMATTSKIPVARGLLREDKYTFQRKINELIKWHEIPDDLVMNFDQMPLSYVTIGTTTLEFKGAKSVPVKGKGKGKQITGTFTASATGTFIPMQLIYAGKTDRCHPQGIDFPEGFDVTHSENHWSNEQLACQHIKSIIIPFANKKKEELGLAEDQKVLLIFDVFRGQTTDNYLKLLDENNFVYVFVPPNLTNHFQPLDSNVNSHAKTFLKQKFQDWYASAVTKQLDTGKDVYAIDIDTKLSVMKPVRARWVISLYDKFRNDPEMIIKAFDMAFVTEALQMDNLDGEDPFSGLM